jgi:hypothetical protein
MAFRSSWSRFPPITLSAVTRDRRHRQDDEHYAADLYVRLDESPRILQPVAQIVLIGVRGSWDAGLRCDGDVGLHGCLAAGVGL